ncbi:hypothetical protein FF80_03924 [Devosia sp. LC5]|uniref:hypothetical protein n=1 Tax=Devosia sp. LC5 TaxID=1502724 RepID=UPI0004E2EBF5|nr:hypothetical protein [Devosia sp. LC5]KFC61728.1 hypothetical protein FF80_03924 [Devosia sp. LC5]
MRSIVVDSSSRSRLVLREVPEAAPLPDQAVVRVHSTSLNQGELRFAMTTAPDGTRPGWDFAEGLQRLIRLVELGSLRPRIALEASWQDIGDVAERFMRREISGKVVLHLD